MAFLVCPSGSATSLCVRTGLSVAFWEDEDGHNRNTKHRTPLCRLSKPLPETEVVKAISMHLQNQGVLGGKRVFCKSQFDHARSFDRYLRRSHVVSHKPS